MRRAGQVLTGACCIAVLVAGPPLALLRLVGPSLPRPPGVDDPDGTAAVHQAVIAAAALTGWLIWAAILAVLAARIGRRLAQLLRHLPQLRMPGPLQSLSAAVLGTVAVTTAASSAAPAAAHATATTSDPWLSPAAHALILSNSTPDRVSGHQHTPAVPSAANRQHLGSSSQLLAYPVAQGDWLGYIAERFLGDFDRYHDIRDLNPDLIPDRSGPHGPDHIQPRWRLKLPADAYDRGPRKHATSHVVPPPSSPTNPGSGADDPAGNPPPTPPHAPPPPHSPAQPVPAPSAPTPPAATSSPTPARGRPGTPTAPVTPRRSATASASPAPSDTAAPSAIDAPGPSPSASDTVASSTPSRSPGAPAPAGTGQVPPKDHPAIGVHLPGGWIPIPLAAALVAAAAMVWLRRRHRFVPGQPAGPVLRDPDLQPLPPAVTVMRRGVRRHAPDPLAPLHESVVPVAAPAVHTADPAWPDTAGGSGAVDPPPIGPSGPDLAGLCAALGTPLPAGGLRLVGDGAHAAARALLVATLSSGGPDDPDARGQVVIPADTLTLLLGVDAVYLDPIPRLTVTANLDQALIRLDELLIQRRRILEDQDVEDLAALRAADPMHPPMPPVLLLAEIPGGQARARLATTLHLGSLLQISAVLLGDRPHSDALDGGTLDDAVVAVGILDVDAEGYTDREDTGRVAVLDTATTVQLLRLLREAHTGQPATTPAPDSPAPSTSDDDRQARVVPDTDRPNPGPTGAAGHGDPSPAAPPTKPAAAKPPAAEPPAGDTASSRRSPDATAIRPAPGRPRVPIQVLGHPAILDDGAPRQALRRRAQELMVYLAVHRGGANLPDIKEAFWPDASNRRAGERLQTEVGDLRGRIRDAHGDITVQPVINSGGRYHLSPDIVEVDWWTVQDALAAATATTDAARRVEHLRRAVAAYHGPLADGCGYDWLPEVQEQVRWQGIIAHTQLAELLVDTVPNEAASLLDRAITLDPYNEDLARAAMRAHTRLGDADAVRGQHHRIRAALDELDLEPDQQTTTLATELLRHLTDTRPRPPAQPEQPDDP